MRGMQLSHIRRQGRLPSLETLLKIAMILHFFCPFIVHAFTSNMISYPMVSPLLKSTRLGFENIISNNEIAVSSEISDYSLTTEARRQLSLNRLENHRNTETKRTIEQSLPSPESVEQEHGDYLTDAYQHETIRSDAPAILLESGPGTGKTTVLASRIAYLLRTKQALPQEMVVLSFTKRDASALKEKALNILYDVQRDNEARIKCGKRLWSGTIHCFAKNILKTCDGDHSSIRIISTAEMRSRIKKCLGRLPPESFHVFKKALDESNQKVGILVTDVMRCIDLWQEAGVISTPYNHPDVSDHIGARKNELDEGKSMSRDTNVKLAMRLGIPCNVAELALEISGDYQTLHASTGTTDPSNVAGLAYHHLLTKPKELMKVRSKLDHVILDEYQDVSVSQHKLLRLLIRGSNNEKEYSERTGGYSSGKTQPGPPHLSILTTRKTALRLNKRRDIPCFRVPKLMCAGDVNQSIYGWRGAAPSLTVDGFHKDFPQGVLVPLNTCYRLPFEILNAANVLVNDRSMIESSNQRSFHISPAAARSTAKQARVTSQFFTNNMFDMSNFALGKKLLIENALISESRSSVFIKGLWDMREEAKFIAMTIQKRSKERKASCASALSKLCIGYEEGKPHGEFSPLPDSTDVAIMLRTSGAKRLFEEALRNRGIPYISLSDAEDEATAISGSNSIVSEHEQTLRHWRGQDTTDLSMKPVRIMTMHSAKGHEFDDVYLAGWSEGVFPHPSSVSNNRLYEERRIAYVALTRARQRVIITHSFVRSVAHFGPKGERKDVTEQNRPSRFLYDLLSKTPMLDSFASNGAIKQPKTKQATVEWDNAIGFKEIIAGKDLPSHFSKSYRAPPSFRLTSPSPIPSTADMFSSHIKKEPRMSMNPEISCNTEMKHAQKKVPLHLVEKVTSGLKEVFIGKRGVMARQRLVFVAILKDCGIKRGAAIVLKQSAHSYDSRSMDALIRASDEDLTTRAFSKCTAKQLGLYLYYILTIDTK